MAELTLTDQNFEKEVLEDKTVALVDFWATWCGPCQAQGPIIKGLADEMKDKPVKIGKLNVDEAAQTAQKYQVMSIPTIIFFKDGQEVERITGLQNKDVLKEKLEKLI